MLMKGRNSSRSYWRDSPAFFLKKHMNPEQNQKLLPVCVLILCLSFVCIRLACGVDVYPTDAEEANAYNVKRVHKNVDGHDFYVEEDRPIEKVAGLYRPMDMDSYIALKFGKLQTQIDQLRSQTQARTDDLQGQIKDLSKKLDQLSKKQAAAAAVAANITTNTTTTTF